MKGLILETNGQRIVAGLRGGSVGMVLSNKEGEYALIVSGTCDGVVFPVWHQQEMNIGDTLTLVYDDVSVDDVSNPIYVDDIRKQEERDLRSLQWWAERKSKMEERKEE